MGPTVRVPQGLPYRLLFSAKRAFFSERPHECQIGSGEGIRTSVRETFESHWLRSIRISVGVFSGFFAGFACAHAKRFNRFGRQSGRSQFGRLTALNVFATG